MKLEYRHDLDGLRAIAVLSVIIYHLNDKILSGGFVGVDVFFVISGFLITSIIVNEINEEKFTISGFYIRRIKRILPNLFLVMLITTIASYFLLLPHHFKDFGTSISAASAFFSNFFFWMNSGYFAEAAQTKPLLHTWSLAIEEQFYIFYPILLIFIHKYIKNSLKPILILITILSFLTNICLVHNFSSTAFYMLFTRGWELSVGGLIAVGVFPALKNKYLSETTSLIGITLILYSIFMFNESMLFPGYNALLPCIGTVLIIWAGLNYKPVINKILSINGIVFIGLLSYSLYLWHWPVLAFHNYYRIFLNSSIFNSFSLLTLIFILSVLTYKFVEVPFRKKIEFTPKIYFISTAMAIIIFASIGLIINKKEGMPERFSQKVQNSVESNESFLLLRQKCFKTKIKNINYNNVCKLGSTKKSKADFALWGDSHALALFSGFYRMAEKKNKKGVFIASRQGVPLIGVNGTGRHNLSEFNQKALEVINNSEIKDVYLAARYSLYTEAYRYKNETGNPVFLRKEGNKNELSVENNLILFEESLENTLQSLIKAGKNIYIIAEVPPVGYNVPEYIIKAEQLKSTLSIEPTLEEYLNRQNKTFKIFEELQKKYSFEIIYPHEILCGSGVCKITEGGKSLYKDDNHFSLEGGNFLIEKLDLPY